MDKWVNISEINNTLGKAIEACKDELTPAFYSGAKYVLAKINEIAEQTEPQTSCKTCRFGEVDEGYVKCEYHVPKDEPQTEREGE